MDLESACYSDMTRTFSVGEPDPELVAWHEHTREALELVRALVLPGADGAELYRTVCRFYEERGYRTRLSAEEGTVLREGFNHALGHGVGLEVHEAPALSRSGQVLAAGDVITLEPLGCTGTGSAASGWRTPSSSPTTVARPSRTSRTTSTLLGAW